MASLIRPGYTLTISGQQWSRQAIAIDLRLAAGPQLDCLTARLPAEAPVEAAPDDPVTLSLDGGDGSETVFTGVVATIRRGLEQTTISAAGALGQLARYRPATTFENVSAGTVIRNLAGDAGVATADVGEGVMLRFYVADPSRDAAEHASRLAAWSGLMLVGTPEGKIAATIVDATQAEVALRYGREVTGLVIEEAAEPDKIIVAGESGVGEGGSPDALRLNADFFAGSRPEGPSLQHHWIWEPALRTTKAAATAGSALQRELAAGRRGGRLDALLLPRLRPGTVIELQDLPAGLAAGPYWLETVRHRIGAGGATTSARLMQGGDSFDPAALLGALGGML